MEIAENSQLPKTIWVSEQGEDNVEVEVEYEWVPPLYSYCKSFGHDTTLCLGTHAWKEKTKTQGEDGNYDHDIDASSHTSAAVNGKRPHFVAETVAAVSTGGARADATGTTETDAAVGPNDGSRRQQSGVQAAHQAVSLQAVLQEQGENYEEESCDEQFDGQLGEAIDSDMEKEEEKDEHYSNIQIGLDGIEKVGLMVEDLDLHAMQQVPPISSGKGWGPDKIRARDHQDNVKGFVGEPKGTRGHSKQVETMGTIGEATTLVAHVTRIP